VGGFILETVKALGARRFRVHGDAHAFFQMMYVGTDLFDVACNHATLDTRRVQLGMPLKDHADVHGSEKAALYLDQDFIGADRGDIDLFHIEILSSGAPPECGKHFGHDDLLSIFASAILLKRTWQCIFQPLAE
jgi:hypothetical protein